jgi:hypothetical protein
MIDLWPESDLSWGRFEARSLDKTTDVVAVRPGPVVAPVEGRLSERPAAAGVGFLPLAFV